MFVLQYIVCCVVSITITYIRSKRLLNLKSVYILEILKLPSFSLYFSTSLTVPYLSPDFLVFPADHRAASFLLTVLL